MHPELLRALGKARHEDLLNEHRIRRQPRVRDDDSPRFPRSRQRIRSLLIWTYELLMDDRGAGFELVDKSPWTDPAVWDTRAASPQNASHGCNDGARGGARRVLSRGAGT
jgi:hypothetical protein